MPTITVSRWWPPPHLLSRLRVRRWLVCALCVLWLRLLWTDVATTSQALPAVRNDLPQPYRTTRDWGELPPGVKWAAVTAIEPAPDGAIFVVHRCYANSCAGRGEAPILKYDPNG